MYLSWNNDRFNRLYVSVLTILLPVDWVAAAEIAQAVQSTSDYEKPYFM